MLHVVCPFMYEEALWGILIRKMLVGKFGNDSGLALLQLVGRVSINNYLNEKN